MIFISGMDAQRYALIMQPPSHIRTHLYNVIALFSGEFGIVYKARLSKGFNKPYSEVVAVKTLKGVHTLLLIQYH